MSPLEGILRPGGIREPSTPFSPLSALLVAAGEGEDARSIFGAQGDVEAWTNISDGGTCGLREVQCFQSTRHLFGKVEDSTHADR
jgi:hypothetical protein